MSSLPLEQFWSKRTSPSYISSNCLTQIEEQEQYIKSKYIILNFNKRSFHSRDSSAVRVRAMSSTGLTIAAACYDGSLHGWQDAKLAFAYQAQYGCVKAMAVSDVTLCKANKRGSRVLLAMGGSDEAVHTYDLSDKKELVQLEEHENDITALCFVGNSFLLSGGEDGKLCVWDCKDWSLMTILKGHKPGPVTSIAVHPSGKVALSTSRDNSLRMWNLENARPASRNRLDGSKSLSHACWSISGDTYAVVADDRRVMVFRIADESGKPFRTLEPSSRVNALTLATPNGEIVLGLEDGRVLVYDADASEEPLEVQCEKRVRALYADRPVTAAAGDKLDTVYAGLSNGVIEKWTGFASGAPEKDEAGTLRAGSNAHLTCMAACSLDAQDAIASSAPSRKKAVKKSEKATKKVAPKSSSGDALINEQKSNNKKRKQPTSTKKEAKASSPSPQKRQRPHKKQTPQNKPLNGKKSSKSPKKA